MGYSQFVNEMYNANEEVENNQQANATIPEGFFSPENITDAGEGKTKIEELQNKYSFQPDGEPISIEDADLVKFYRGEPGPFAQGKQKAQSTMSSDISQYEIQNPKQAIYYRVLSGTGIEDPTASVEVIGVLAGPSQAEETPVTQLAAEQPETAPAPAPAVEQPAEQTQPVQEEKSPEPITAPAPIYEAKRYLRKN